MKLGKTQLLQLPVRSHWAWRMLRKSKNRNPNEISSCTAPTSQCDCMRFCMESANMMSVTMRHIEVSYIFSNYSTIT